MSTTEKHAMPVTNRTFGFNARWCLVIAAGLVAFAGAVHAVARLIWYLVVLVPLDYGFTTEQLTNLRLFDYEPASFWQDGVGIHLVALIFIVVDLAFIWAAFNAIRFFTGRVRNWANHRANDRLRDKVESVGLWDCFVYVSVSGFAVIIMMEEWGYAVELIMLTH